MQDVDQDGGAVVTAEVERTGSIVPVEDAPLLTARFPEEPPAAAPATRRRWVLPAVVGAATLVVGGGVGGVVGARAADDQVRVDALTTEVADLEQDVADVRDEVEDTRAQAADDIAGARAAAEAAAAADHAARQAELDARSAGLDGREADLMAREGAVAVLEQQAEDGRIAGSGTHLVGTEVAPGTYRASSPDDCYWERLSGLSGDFDEIIANGIGAGDATVTIRSGDLAFSSERCGYWDRIG